MMEFGNIKPGTSDTPAASPAVDADNFRTVMRQLVGSVTVITTEESGVLYGFTATAVCSVCAAPPTILIVVNKSTRTHQHIDQKGVFVVNILAENQKDIAQHFASKSDNQFTTVNYSVSERGVPILQGVAAHLECEIKERISIGTHTIFIGEVLGTSAEPRAPLIYHDARYGLVSHL